MSIAVTLIRHPKERLSKCTLQPLVGRSNLTFLKASKGLIFDATGYTLLAVEAPPLSSADAGRPLLILDSTWALLKDLQGCLSGEPIKRSLVGVKTAYPRKSKVKADPLGGLASVEALYAALRLLGEDDPTLLDHYHWKAAFLAQFM